MQGLKNFQLLKVHNSNTWYFKIFLGITEATGWDGKLVSIHLKGDTPRGWKNEEKKIQEMEN